MMLVLRYLAYSVILREVNSLATILNHEMLRFARNRVCGKEM